MGAPHATNFNIVSSPLFFFHPLVFFLLLRYLKRRGKKSGRLGRFIAGRRSWREEKLGGSRRRTRAFPTSQTPHTWPKRLFLCCLEQTSGICHKSPVLTYATHPTPPFCTTRIATNNNKLGQQQAPEKNNLLPKEEKEGKKDDDKITMEILFPDDSCCFSCPFQKVSIFSSVQKKLPPC